MVNWLRYTDLVTPQAPAVGRNVEAQVDELYDRLDRMSLLTYAMWTLTRDKLGITEEELADRVQELDLSDGKLDGKMGAAAVDCPKCRRRIAARHRRCIYCGTARD